VAYLSISHADVTESGPRASSPLLSTPVVALERQRAAVAGLALIAVATAGLLTYTSRQPHAVISDDAPSTPAVAEPVVADPVPAGRAVADPASPPGTVAAPAATTTVGKFTAADLAGFRQITQDTLGMIQAVQQSAAVTRIKELQTSWDDAGQAAGQGPDNLGTARRQDRRRAQRTARQAAQPHLPEDRTEQPAQRPRLRTRLSTVGPGATTRPWPTCARTVHRPFAPAADPPYGPVGPPPIAQTPVPHNGQHSLGADELRRRSGRTTTGSATALDLVMEFRAMQLAFAVLAYRRPPTGRCRPGAGGPVPARAAQHRVDHQSPANVVGGCGKRPSHVREPMIDVSSGAAPVFRDGFRGVRMGLSIRWVVPALVGAGIVGLATVPHAVASGSGSPTLPSLTAAQLMSDVRSSSVRALSGTVGVDSALGLPSLPDRLVGSALGLPALLTGSHTMRVAVDGADRQRIALLGDLSETDLVHDGADLWVYDSGTNTVTHHTVSGSSLPSLPGGAATDLTPQGQAQQWLSDLDPSTIASLAPTATVAGRPAYQLQLSPRAAGSLVGAVRIAIDSATGVPLRVQVIPAGSTNSAFTVGFRSISFSAPSAATFQFTPPPGATVASTPSSGPAGVGSEPTAAPQPAEPGPSSATATPSGQADSSAPVVSGTGWASVVQLPASDLSSVLPNTNAADPGRSRTAADWIDRLATQVPQGHLLTTRLFSLLLTPDGRVLIGAVTPSVLEAQVAS
jgi:outer membrane lipoprotein-sorting protein